MTPASITSEPDTQSSTGSNAKVMRELARRPAKAEARMPVLEKYFRKYPETPREIILKADLLGLGHWFSDAALAATAGTLVKSYRLFSYDLMKMGDMKRRENRKAPEDFIILGGQYDLRPVAIQTTLAADSPYVVDVVDGRLVLTVDGKVISEVRYAVAPNYYQNKFADGTAYDEIIAFGGFVTAFRTCQYWGPDEECRFCDINENARQMKQSRDFTFSAPVKPAKYVHEVAKAVAAEVAQREGYAAPHFYLLTGGTILNKLHGKTENEFYAEYVQALRSSGRRAHVELQTNAKPLAELKWFQQQGLNGHHANMEVWDRRLFAWMNPGKNRRIGYDDWVKWMCDSVEVFGAGSVSPNFVGGIEMSRPYGFETVEEAVASTTEGLEFLMAHGVTPRFNQWRREPNTDLARQGEQPPIPLDYYVQLMRNRWEIWKKYRLPLPCRRAGLHAGSGYLGASHGTYDDYILLMENAYPSNVVELIDRYSTPFDNLPCGA